MAFFKSREITMPRGWVVIYKDGTVLCEDDLPWGKLPKDKEIERVVLKWEDRLWSISGKEHYTVPMKRGFININTVGVSEGLASRSIGFYDMKERCKILLRVDEGTGKMVYESVPLDK